MARSAYHRELMRNYYAGRDAYELRRDEFAIGYATEEKLYDEIEKPFTFKNFLIGMAR